MKGKTKVERRESAAGKEERKGTRSRGVLGIKRDIDKESLILTDRPTDGYILS